MSREDPELVDVERTPLLQPKDRSADYASTRPSALVAAAAAKEDPHEHDFPPPSPDGHFPFLDLTRICCVWLVAIDHGNASFGQYNMLFGQEWVLQFLFLVCGVCYGMSKRSLGSYNYRLAQYVAIGVLINLSAWIITGRDWQHNIFGVVFHFWFVVGLMMYATILAPLKPYLQRVRDKALESAETPEAVGPAADEPRHVQQDQRDQLLRGLLLIGGGLLGIMLFFTVVMDPVMELTAPVVLHLFTGVGNGAQFWGAPSNLEESHKFLMNMCSYFMLTCSNLYLLIVCPMVFKRSTLTAWTVLLYTYAHRLLFYRAKDERPFHGLDLMTIALAVYYLGLQHRRKIGEYVARYWFLVLFGCAVLWPPGANHRFDEEPPTDISTRVRVNALEAIFVIGWFVAGERLIQKEIFTEDRMEFLNMWALIVFLVHKAVHMVCPSPVNWIVLLGIAPACYYCMRR